MAELYNVSCIAADHPDVLRLIPDLALRYFLPTDPIGPLKPSDLQLSGHHYFSNTTTPVFAFDSPKFGTVFAAKGDSSEAPSNAGGAIPWLYLTSRSSTESDIKVIYRLDTVGGQPPETCTNMQAAFSVDYAAIYWFWK